MKEQLISFETAKLAKEKGFNEGASNWYNRKGSLNGIVNLDEEGNQVHSSMGSYQPDHSRKVSKDVYNECRSHKYPASSQSLLQRWLRKEHQLHINVADLGLNTWSFLLSELQDGGTKNTGGHLGKVNYDTYEEALEVGLQEALKLI